MNNKDWIGEWWRNAVDIRPYAIPKTSYSALQSQITTLAAENNHLKKENAKLKTKSNSPTNLESFFHKHKVNDLNELEAKITKGEQLRQDIDIFLIKWNAPNFTQLSADIQNIIDGHDQFEQKWNNAKKEVDDKQIQINSLISEKKILEQRIKNLEEQEENNSKPKDKKLEEEQKEKDKKVIDKHLETIRELQKKLSQQENKIRQYEQENKELKNQLESERSKRSGKKVCLDDQNTPAEWWALKKFFVSDIHHIDAENIFKCFLDTLNPKQNYIRSEILNRLKMYVSSILEEDKSGKQDFNPSIKHTFSEWQILGSSYFANLEMSNKEMDFFYRFISPYDKYSLEELQRMAHTIKRIKVLNEEIEKEKKLAESSQKKEKERRSIGTEIDDEEGDLQKIKEKIKSLKEERKKYLPDAEGFTTKDKIEREKELTKEIDRLERKEKETKQAQKVAEIRKISRNINDWAKIFQINNKQFEKLKKLAELGTIIVDFDTTLYSWKEIEEILNKSLPVKRDTIFNWWISNKIGEEDYLLLKNAGIDVNKEKLTEKELWELIDKTEQTFSKPVDKRTFKVWYESGMINQEHYEILLNIKVNPEQEFTLQEISELIKKSPKMKTIDEWFKEKKIVPEDYELLKKANVDTEKTKFSLPQVNSLIIEHDKEE